MDSLSKLIRVNSVMTKYLCYSDTVTIQTFLTIASHSKPVSYSRIIKSIKISAVRLSRCLKRLIDDDLVTFEIDDHDTRRKIASLTQRGKAFTLELVEAMEDTQ